MARKEATLGLITTRINLLRTGVFGNLSDARAITHQLSGAVGQARRDACGGGSDQPNAGVGACAP